MLSAVNGKREKSIFCHPSESWFENSGGRNHGDSRSRTVDSACGTDESRNDAYMMAFEVGYIGGWAVLLGATAGYTSVVSNWVGGN